jgi:lipopolysaccharide/colanic/teichoic acid biosynthesis glycosyltransferase
MLLKFRSMIENAEKESGVIQARIGDNRITKVGKIIRAIRVDELPQLINILKGDMSLVGPRPERVETFEEYSEKFPQFRYRLMVKAGLTGYAQIYGKYMTSLEEKLKMDLYYIERRSILLDFMLLFATIKVLFIRESSQGVEEDYNNMAMD